MKDVESATARKMVIGVFAMSGVFALAKLLSLLAFPWVWVLLPILILAGATLLQSLIYSAVKHVFEAVMKPYLDAKVDEAIQRSQMRLLDVLYEDVPQATDVATECAPKVGAHPL